MKLSERAGHLMSKYAIFVVLILMIVISSILIKNFLRPQNLINVAVQLTVPTILACGAGAVSKVRDPGSSQLVRIFNFKYPHEYRSRFAEMLERKDKVRETYARFRCADPVQEIEKIAGDV